MRPATQQKELRCSLRTGRLTPGPFCTCVLPNRGILKTVSMTFRIFSRCSAISLPMLCLSAALLRGAESADRAFQAVADEYFDKVLFHYQPSTGTYLGLHQYDTQLEDFSRAAIAAQQRDLHAYEKRVAAVPPEQLNSINRADHEMLLNSIRSALLTSEAIQPWKKNPDLYASSLASSAFTLMERKFAPPADRLRSLIAREHRMPANLTAAHTNLENPPHVSTDIALRQIEGNIRFFEKDLPAAFADVHDANLEAEFRKANGDVVRALREYGTWLKTDLLPRSHGDFRMGAKTYSEKLLYDEMVDAPLPKLLDIAYADLRKNQASFKRIAHEVDPAKQPTAVLNELGSDHPAPSHLLKAFSDTFDGLIQFIQAKHIITIPSDIRPTLEETPPFMRATTFASMDTPGPFEKKAREAYFNVTLPDPASAQSTSQDYRRQHQY